MTIIEVLVSILLVLAVIAIAASSTQRVLSVHQRVATTDARRSALTDALHTLERHLATVSAARGDLLTATDSVLAIVHDIGMTTLCRAAGDTLVVTSGPDSVPWAATLPRAITTDDRLLVWHDREERWVARRVLAATPAAGPCGDSSLAWPATGTQQLVLDSGTAGLRPGVVVRVRQQERWSRVRGSDGTWALSLATWDATRAQYATPQPLLSPLATPAARSGPGLVVRALDAQGRALTDSLLARTQLVQIALRLAGSARLPAIADSVRVYVSAP